MNIFKKLIDSLVGLINRPTRARADVRQVIIQSRYVYTVIRKCHPVPATESGQDHVVIWEARRFDSLKRITERCVLTEICTPTGKVLKNPHTSQILYSVDNCLNMASRRHMRDEGLPV